MGITVQDISNLRNMTGAGMMDCKNALIDANGDIDKAIEILREKGIAKAAKKEGRIAAEGFIESYVHGGGLYASLIEINTETDFAAKNAELREFAHNLAMQVVASRPICVNIADVPQDKIEQEKNIYRTQLLNEGKPENMVDRIVEGKISKYYEEVVLMEQVYIRDPEGNKKVKDVLTDFIAKIGEKITIRRFVLLTMGEGLEKRNDNFAEEVAAQANMKK